MKQVIDGRGKDIALGRFLAHGVEFRGGLTMENSYEVEGILCKSSVPYSDQQLVN